MAISAGDVAKLRDMTGAGMMDAKRALTEAAGDINLAVTKLRESGAVKAAKKAERATGEGRVHTYSHGNGKLGVLVEVLCETDFVARNEQFIAFCQDLTMHIAAMAPEYLSREDVPAAVIEGERTIYRAQLVQEGKPADMIEKIVDGKMSKFFEERCLLEQRFVKDEDITIAKLLEDRVLTIGENLKIARFVRMQIGG